MDHVKTIASLPIILGIGVIGWAWDRLHPESDAEYMVRKYPSLVIHDWTD